MKKFVFENYNALSVYAAQYIVNEINSKPDYVLGLPTGGTPVGMYDEIEHMYKKGMVDFSDVKTFNLDEYLGLNKKHEQSYYYFMNKNLYSRVNVKPENTHIPNGMADDFAVEALNYDKQIKEAGGIDLMVLGLGPNGHIGFNEPDSELIAPTHVVSLTQETIKANARFFSSENDVPQKAITMGVGSILKSKKILILVSGESKKEAAAQMMSNKITTQNPSTLLQLHPDVTVLIDKAADSE